MAKISHEFSYTFQPGNGNQWSKITLGVSDVDTTLPIEPQIRDIENATSIIWDFLRNKVDQKIEEIYEEAQKGKEIAVRGKK